MTIPDLPAADDAEATVKKYHSAGVNIFEPPMGMVQNTLVSPTFSGKLVIPHDAVYLSTSVQLLEELERRLTPRSNEECSLYQRSGRYDQLKQLRQVLHHERTEEAADKLINSIAES